MMKKCLILGTAFVFAFLPAEKLQAQSLFADYKAHGVGDIVTIYIVEFSTASNSASSKTDNSNKAGLQSGGGSGALKFLPLFGADLSYGNSFDGKGETSQRGQLKAKLSAKIVEESPNGTLKIQGKKIVQINGDKQITVLTGWIRPEDISTDNIVYSYAIADAQISYQGKGVVNAAQKPGWITKLINWVF
ncbi:flagellar L-ring protein precursor [bacterium BMS3Abin05]|nr:flagellar L-ring protein precursor [bacterium BMS3Abin05]GBE28861.1 flagellar L-ring protein precursor [bacterium BMS3Bbin03]